MTRVRRFKKDLTDLAAYLGSHSPGLILSSADFFCKLSTYSSQTTLEIFYTVNVIRGNDLSYDACKKVQERPYSAFQY